MLVGAGGNAVRPGDRVRSSMRLSEPLGLANPELGDPRLQARARGVDLVGSARAATKLEAGAWFAPRRIADTLHRAMSAAIDHRLVGAGRAFVHSLVLGERAAVGRDVEDGFRAAGATHVLSVSGLHLTAIARDWPSWCFVGCSSSSRAWPSGGASTRSRQDWPSRWFSFTRWSPGKRSRRRAPRGWPWSASAG